MKKRTWSFPRRAGASAPEANNKEFRARDAGDGTIQRLRDREEQLQLFVEHAPAAIAMFDREMRYIAASRRWKQDYHLLDVDLIGRAHYEVFPEIPHRWKEFHRRGLQGEVVRSQGDELFERVDGTLQWLNWEIRPWPAADGAVGGILIFTEETSLRKAHAIALEANVELERRVAERTAKLQEAQRSSALAAAIVQHSDDAVISKALDGTILSWNPGAQKVFGFSAQEMIGTPVLRLFPLDRLEEEATLRAEMKAGRHVSHFQTKRVRKDGARIDVSVTLSPILDEQGNVFAIAEIARDITEQLLRQQAKFQGLLESAEAERAHLAAVIRYCEDAIISEAPDGTVLTWNAGAESLFGYPAREMIGHAITRLFPADRVQEEDRLLARLVAGQEVSHYETQRVRKDGTLIDVSVMLSRICDETGKIVAVSKIARDITQRKLSEQKIAEQHEMLRVTLESIGDAVITTDRAGRIQWLNPVAARLTGWPVSEACGRPLDEVFHIICEETRLCAPSPITRALAESCVFSEQEQTVLIGRDGTEHGIANSAAPIRDAAGNVLGIVLVFHDVTEQRRLAREVSHRATHDALTGLANRTEFEARLRRAMASVREDGDVHALLYVDLDQFKLVNDACGHSAGDQLLREVTKICRGAVRARDALARLGGDEFGILVENCSVGDATRIAQHLCERMEQFRFVQEDRRFRVGASVGLVPIDARWTSEAEVLRAADAACYAAKEAGRNRVHVWVDTDVAITERQGEMQWVTRLESALDERRFRLYGQCIVPCGNRGSATHIEVLLRLLDVTGDLVSPAVFFPAAERFNLASRIDRWVLREVLERMATLDLNAVETVSVNLSRQSLADRSFHRYAIELIGLVPFNRNKLCFEITETAVITHLGDAEEFIAAMRALGVRIALDDFGAGVSSFGYLKNLPVDSLKIDGQFVRDILCDPLDHTTITFFRDIAAACDVRTVAEWVEATDVLAELERLGIDFAQGYLIHRPEPLERLLPPAP